MPDIIKIAVDIVIHVRGEKNDSKISINDSGSGS